MAKVKLKDIAQETGISISTVSRVLNSNDYKCASDSTIQKIFNAVSRLGYVKTTHVNDVDNDNKRRVDVILGSSKEDKYSHSFYSQIYKGIEERLKYRNCSLELYYTTDEIRCNKDVLERVKASKSQALIIIEELGQEVIREIKMKYNHIVNIGLNNLRSIENDLVLVDVYRITKNTIQAMIDKGFNRIALIGGGHANLILSKEPYENIIDERFIAYRDTLLINGIPLDDKIIYDANWDPHEAYNIVNSMIEKGIIFDAIFAADDMMAVACLKALQDNDIKVPEQCSLLGFDDLPISSFSNPQISTIHIPRFQMGITAVDILVLKLEGFCIMPMRISLDPYFIQRDTCILEKI